MPPHLPGRKLDAHVFVIFDSFFHISNTDRYLSVYCGDSMKTSNSSFRDSDHDPPQVSGRRQHPQPRIQDGGDRENASFGRLCLHSGRSGRWSPVRIRERLQIHLLPDFGHIRGQLRSVRDPLCILINI
jgi:hypothetical protein